MKKILFLICTLMFSANLSFAEDIVVVTDVNMTNFWEKNGKIEQKVLNVGQKIIYSNKLDVRVPIQTIPNKKIVNAHARFAPKHIAIYYGILPYLDNDDELAYILAHETAHMLDIYGGLGKWVTMLLNSQKYEYKADLIGIDLMVKAGYNPIAAICAANKFMPEITYNFGIFTSHPHASKRLVEMYKYIYLKYPKYLGSDMTTNISYQNFLTSSSKELRKFRQEQSKKANKSNNL